MGRVFPGEELVLFSLSRIDGEFEGWDDSKVYKLENGQQWQMVQSQYQYQYIYNPKALIWRDRAYRYYLEVPGMRGENVEVKPVEL